MRRAWADSEMKRGDASGLWMEMVLRLDELCVMYMLAMHLYTIPLLISLYPPLPFSYSFSSPHQTNPALSLSLHHTPLRMIVTLSYSKHSLILSSSLIHPTDLHIQTPVYLRKYSPKYDSVTIHLFHQQIPPSHWQNSLTKNKGRQQQTPAHIYLSQDARDVYIKHPCYFVLGVLNSSIVLTQHT